MSVLPQAHGDTWIPAIRNDSDQALEEVLEKDTDEDLDTEYFCDIFAMAEDEDEEEEEDKDTVQLSISAEHAEANYLNAGAHMEEFEDSVKIEDFKEYISEKAEAALQDLDTELNLPYETAPFQRIAINCIAENKSVILVKECGSGKMDVALKGALVKRVTECEPKGLTIVVQPLSSLMREKMENNIAPAAVLSMGQELDMLEDGSDGEKAVLSCSLEELFSGRIAVLLGHPESFSTQLGQFILSKAQQLNRILLLVLDEWHAYDSWDTFRPGMLRMSCRILVFARKDAPVVSMTATATSEEIERLVQMLGLQQNRPVVIHSCPVQPYHKFSILRRPSNCHLESSFCQKVKILLLNIFCD